MNSPQQEPFLRVPPFPGALETALAIRCSGLERPSDSEIDKLMDLIAELKVGGNYWGSQPALPSKPYVLVRIEDGTKRARALRDAGAGERVLCWADGAAPAAGDAHLVSGACDPWHLVRGASRVIVDSDDELALIAAIARVPLTCVGIGTFSDLASEVGSPCELGRVFREHVVEPFSYRNPFTGEPASLEAAVRLCGFWRQLIDSNRDISNAVGFAFWKRPTVAPLLWGGSDINFSNKGNCKTGTAAVWKARTPAQTVEKLERETETLIEVEDGFIRSAGLGADCVPPLSIVVDRLGVHFDPSAPSELERLIENGPFTDEIVERARKLRELIIASGVSKYGAGRTSLRPKVPGRRHVLVPGQVEDDRAVTCGGGEVRGNLDLLRRVRQEAPDAYILYKPHPDVEAGHRAGSIAEAECLEFADEIVRDQPISGLIELADEVQVNTSLAGFEALLRLKPVTTHGVPFYAGWGLTRDLGQVPARRTAKRTIDELVAAVLLLYPRYLDPLTGLPCPPEILVRRIVDGVGRPRNGVVVQMRRLQGRWKKRLASLGVAR